MNQLSNARIRGQASSARRSATRSGRLIAAMIATVIAGGVLAAAPANAFALGNCRFGTSDPQMRYRTNGVRADLWVATQAGAGRWNSSAAPGAFSAWTSGQPTNVWVSEYSFLDKTIWAQTTGSCTASNPAWIGDVVYLKWASESTLTLGAAALRKVATHELGHVYGIGDLGLGTCAATPAVMVQGAAKWTCGWGLEPWADDVDGVTVRYLV